MVNEVGSVGSAAAVTAVPVVEPKSKRTRGILNKVLLKKLMQAEKVARAARLEAHIAALQQREITMEYIDSLDSDIKAARDTASAGMQHGTAGRRATADHSNAQEALEAALREVQKAAKQKYARTNRIALGDYFVGQKLNGSVPNLTQTSQAILNKLAEDELPGFTAAKIKSLKTARQSWLDSKATQSVASASAQTARAELNTLLKSIEDRRIAIQFAADAEWPHTDEANAGIRHAFELSPKRSMKV
jgi:hypothetical protein